jgi:hypothetical protein
MPDLAQGIDRIAWRDGQLLTAQDLRDDKRRDDRLRRLHTAFLHDTWGIALGFAVRRALDGAALIVGPGYAVTMEGFDIVLSETMRVSVPGISGPAPLVLAAGFVEDGDFRDSTASTGLCLGKRTLGERPAFRWRLPEEVRFGPEVPLAKITVAEGRIQGRLNTRVRRTVRPLARPFIASGSTDPGNTGWHDRSEGAARFVEATVDTSVAGFTRPFYFGRLNVNGGDPAGAAPGAGASALGLDALTFIRNPGSGAFTFAILVQQSLQPGLAISAEAAERRQWTVDWFGMEPVSGCEPVASSLRVFDRAGINRAIL